MEQVLMNLAVNARDAMPKGGVLTIETANVTLGAEYAESHLGVAPGDYVMMAVSDTGTGMDADTQSRAFEPFFTTKGPGAGTGLGLSTCYGIVKQHGGNIWLYSEPGEGTTFKIYLPAVDEHAQRKTRPTAPARGGSETLLVVEDEPSVLSIAGRVLTSSGYRVLEAGDAAEAHEVFAEHRDEVDLLVTDVILPDINGRQLYEQLREQRPDLKVLFMSGYTDNAIVHHGVLDEGVEFMQKPFTPNQVARRVREALEAEVPPAH
jgi:CheY-like chemotaxis protein